MCPVVVWHGMIDCAVYCVLTFLLFQSNNQTNSVAEQPNLSQLLQNSKGTSLCFIGCETFSSRRFDFSWRTWGGPERRPKSKDQLSSVTLN